MKKRISIYEPELLGNERKYLLDCIDSNWISSQGSYINKFENKLADYHNSKFCIATSSCTTALHLALKALDIGEGDEVICPNLTFIAPANMILLSGATLKLVDIDKETLCLDNISFKVEMGTSGQGGDTDVMRLGLGYMF